MQATTQTTNGQASGHDAGGLVDPAVLALLRCPATKEALREVVKPDGTRVLTNASGTHEYAFVRGIAVLIAAK